MFPEERTPNRGPELLANDGTAREIVKNWNLPRERARDLARSVVSMKVSAVKPAA
jgi:hypothetical protein